MDEELKKYLYRNLILLLMIFVMIVGISFIVFAEMNALVEKMKEPMKLELDSNLSLDKGSLSEVFKNTSHNIIAPDFSQDTENLRDAARSMNSATENLKDTFRDMKNSTNI
ncbi:MAG: hypothetical protein LBD03_01325 [Methanobrevibacter sp.]|jgi:methyl-accepting chemotaxis protein|nr:hypothetical protein [Candidatus Methanovirga procula]